jgi:hypothetical protein
MTRWARSRVALVASVLLVGVIAEAEPAAGPPPGAGFGIRAAPGVPAAPRPTFRLEPTRPAEETWAREQEYFPGTAVRGRHEPAFVQPFVVDVPVSRDSTARAGLSGWTAPALPYDTPGATGGIAFGLTIVWPIPPSHVAVGEPEPDDGR